MAKKVLTKLVNIPTTEHLIQKLSRSPQSIEINNVDTLKAIELVDKLTDSSSGETLIKPIHYSELEGINMDTILFLMNQLGLYTFPTIELVEWLEDQIDEYSEGYEPAIEICAGTGWLGRSLGIPITDSRIQESNEEVINAMNSTGNVPIRYPSDVEKLEATEAIKKYNPEYVIASYATHKYGIGGSKNSGYMYGVNTPWVVTHCHKYFLIGSTRVHSSDPIMKRPHQSLKFPWLLTRSGNELSRVFIWENKQW